MANCSRLNLKGASAQNLLVDATCPTQRETKGMNKQSFFMHIPQSVSEARWAVEVSTELVHQSKEDPG